MAKNRKSGASAAASRKAAVKNTNVAVLKFHGPIGVDDEDDGITYDKYERLIAAAFSSPDTKAVALDIDCPGGDPVETDMIAREIRRQAEGYKKPVFAFVRGMAASGGYWLACAADGIFAMPLSEVGSIGVISQLVNTRKRDKKMGLEFHVVTAGTHKSQLNPHKPFKKYDFQKLREMQKEIHKEFKGWVKQSRGERLKGSDKFLMNGDCWTGRSALKFGLIDGIGDMKDVLPNLLGGFINLIVYKPAEKESGMDLKKLFEKIAESEDSDVRALPRRMMPKVMSQSHMPRLSIG